MLLENWREGAARLVQPGAAGRIDDHNLGMRRCQVAMFKACWYHHAAGCIDKGGAAVDFKLHAALQGVQNLHMAVGMRLVLTGVAAHRGLCAV